MKWSYAVLAPLLGLTVFAFAEEPEKKTKELEQDKGKKWELVSEVTEVTLEGTKVIASGTVNSAGWENPRLEPFKEDADGIYRFKFQAQRPEGPAAQVVTPIGRVEYDFKKLPANLHKVVVEAAGN